MNSHIRSYKQVRDKFTFRDSDMESSDTTIEEDVVEEEEDTSEEDAEDSATLNTVLLPIMLGGRK